MVLYYYKFSYILVLPMFKFMRSILTTLLVLLAISLYAQKLPNVQQVSLRAPANVKIDGKADEWNNKFEAYNKSTDFYYTLANNDEKLYLIIKATDRYVFNKIIEKGVTLSLKDLNRGNSISFTFPYYINNSKRQLSLDLKGDMNHPGNKAADAEIAENNKLLREKHRFIKVESILGIESLISIYNEKGIEVAELFDNDKTYTLEMAIDFKLIGVSPKNEKKISYQLKVNPIPGHSIPTDPSSIITSSGKPASPEAMAQLNIIFAKMFGGSDFSSGYTLAK